MPTLYRSCPAAPTHFPTSPISKEPLGPAVRQGDDQWFHIIQWTVFATFIAFMIFGTLAAFQNAFDSGVDLAADDRLIVLNKINFTQSLPVSYANRVRAVDDVSFTVRHGEVLGVVGESGCGKSVTALSIMRLLPPGGRIADGQVLLTGRDLTALPEREMRRVRGGRMAMIFQEPMTSLNPLHTLEKQLAESLALHQGLQGAEARDRILEQRTYEVTGTLRQLSLGVGVGATGWLDVGASFHFAFGELSDLWTGRENVLGDGG